MPNKYRQMGKTAAVAFAGAFGGFICATVMAADVIDLLRTTTSMTDGNAIVAFRGETPEALAEAAKLGITAYEDDTTVGGHGAPQKTLLDNEVVRVNLVAFQKGFKRSGGMKRRYDQLLVYVDQGGYTLTTSNGKPMAKPASHKVAPGSSIFHRRESVINDSVIDQDYRVLFIAMKK